MVYLVMAFRTLVVCQSKLLRDLQAECTVLVSHFYCIATQAEKTDTDGEYPDKSK